MGVLLGLGDVELAPAGLRERLGERAGLLGREGDRDRQARLVLGHRHDEQVARAPAGRRARRGRSRRSRVGQGVGRAGGPGRPGSWRGRSASPSRDDAVDAVDDGRRDELVVLAARVGRLDRGGRAAARCPLAVDDRVVAALDPVPALVAIHREVAAADRRDPGVRVGRARAAPRGRATNPRADAAACRGRRAARGCGRAGRPARAASSTSATRWRSLAWTPPGPTRLTRCSVPPALAGARARREERRPRRRTSRRRWRHRSAAGPGGPAGRRRGSGGRPRSCPSGRAAGRPPPPTRRGRRAASRASSARQVGIGAAAMASAAGSVPIPNPSRTTRTIGRGRIAVRRRRPSRGRAAGRGGQAGPGHDPGHLVGLERGAADERAVDRRLGQELGDVRRA